MSRMDIDRFQLGSLLGTGTVGTIFSATDRETGQQVAVKKLNAHASADPLIRARFKREMAILERLRHPNIVNYFGGGSDNRSLFYVMEIVDGGTVKSVLQPGGPLPWQSVVVITIELCSALQCAHNHGVVHRDLKPGNLFLTSAGRLKLGDFGIARDLTRADLTEAGFAVGTHSYMAPEQIRGEHTVSAKADLYSLGCCLFEMLIGSKPFFGDTYAKLFDQHIKAAPPRVRETNSEIPQQLDEIVNQLLEKSPDDRPFNARQVQAGMLQILEAENKGGGPTANDSATSDSATNGPVPDSPIATKGRQVLISRIGDRFLTPPQPEISWKPLLIVLVAIVAVIAIAALFRQ